MRLCLFYACVTEEEEGKGEGVVGVEEGRGY